MTDRSIPRPKTLDDLRKTDVVLAAEPKLRAADCPVSRKELLSHIACETFGGYPEATDEVRLHFARHARIGRIDYWLWRFTAEQEEQFVMVERGRGLLRETVTSTGSVRGLSVDQIILGAHAGVLWGYKAAEGPARKAVETGVSIRCVKPWGTRIKRLAVTIDGQKRRATWGENAYALEPGKHTVQVHADDFWSSGYALAAGPVDVHVHSHRVTRLVYRRGKGIRNFLPGRFRLEPEDA